MATIRITTLGLGHGPAPTTDIELIDLRPYRDPHVRPEFRELTAYDQVVRDTVRTTPGIPQLLAATVAEITDYAERHPQQTVITAATACVGGRHRGAAFGMDLQEALTALGHTVHLEHRDLNKPVIQR